MSQCVRTRLVTVPARDTLVLRTQGTCWVVPVSEADQASARNVYGLRYNARAVFMDSAKGVIIPGNTTVEVMNAFAGRAQTLVLCEVHRFT